MNLPSLSRIATSLLLVYLAGAPVLWGQGEVANARLTGTVLDPDNAVVPEAKVMIANAVTGFTRHFLTGPDGRYTFTLLPPGLYQLRVEKDGFSTYVQSNMLLAVGQSSSLDPKLGIGAVSQVVEVAADAPLLNTGNANIGSEVSGKQVCDLPLNTRNVYGLVGLSSGVNNSQIVQGFT